MQCPVCSFDVDEWEICENCGYQNSGAEEGTDNGDLDAPPGPNQMTLREARLAYEEGREVL